MLEISKTETGQLRLGIAGGNSIHLDTREALGLLARLSDLLPTMPAPDLRVTQDEDGGTVLVCPHCERPTVPVEVDAAVRRNEADFASPEWGPALYVVSSEENFETMGWRCRKCEGVVSVPGEIGVTFS